MQAATWATRLTSGRRSSRDIRQSCRVAGTFSWASGRSRSPSPGRLIGELDECPRQLLDEQRHAIGPGDDFAADRVGQRVAALDGGGHRLDGGPAQPVEHQARDVRMARQIGLAVRPAGQQHEDAPILDGVEHRWTNSSVEGSIQCTSSMTTSTGLRGSETRSSARPASRECGCAATWARDRADRSALRRARPAGWRSAGPRSRAGGMRRSRVSILSSRVCRRILGREPCGDAQSAG